LQVPELTQPCWAVALYRFRRGFRSDLRTWSVSVSVGAARAITDRKPVFRVGPQGRTFTQPAV
jgi:hypothetical protein